MPVMFLTAVSIPLSVLVTFIGLHLGGHSLNMLTLGALTIAVGRIVDDSIVVIENIKRHLAYGETKRDAILTGVREVAGAITVSTLTTVAVFLPISVVGGSVDVVVTALDETELDSAANLVLEQLRDAPDAAEIASDLAPGQPIVQVSVDREEALEHGLTETQVLGIVAGTLSPQAVGSITMDGEELDIFIDTDTVPGTPAALRKVELPTMSGMIPLSDVAKVSEEGQSVEDAVYHGARQRLRPILMTALATIGALTPMALGVTGSAGFISQDLAIVVIGGLISSTALTLILVPVLYRLVEGRRERRAARAAERSTR